MAVVYSQNGVIVKRKSKGNSITALYNASTNSEHYLTISNLNIRFYDRIEFIAIPGTGQGNFKITSTSSGASSYNGIGLNSMNYLDLGGYNYGSYGGTVTGVINGFVNKISLKIDSIKTNITVLNAIQSINSDNEATYADYVMDELKIFKGRSSYNCGSFSFIGLKVFSDTGIIKYDFRPIIKDGISGVIENINGIFTPVPFTDDSMRVIEIMDYLS
ncbi:MAG: hypothetical protein VZR33_08855 [Methanosphaera sp.]|nr:hypothetical protein [Methanosphaera sp.]